MRYAPGFKKAHDITLLPLTNSETRDAQISVELVVKKETDGKIYGLRRGSSFLLVRDCRVAALNLLRNAFATVNPTGE